MKLVIKATSVVVGGLHPKLHKMFVQVKSEIYVRARLQVLGSQCSDRPGNRTPPSLRLGLHSAAQCCCGNVAILNKYQPSSSNCDVRV